MTAGLRVYNQSGVLQIDDRYRNMSLVQKNTVALSGVDGNTCYADLQRTQGNSVIAWRSDFPVSRGYSPEGYYRLYADRSRQNQQITCYIFDWPQLITKSKLGLQVYRTDGVLVFDSGMRWLKIVDAINTGSAGSSGTANNYPAKTYATLLANPAGSISFGQVGGADAQGNASFSVTSDALGTYSLPNGLGWASVRYYNGAQIRAQAVPAPQNSSTGLGQALLVDVSNY